MQSEGQSVKAKCHRPHTLLASNCEVYIYICIYRTYFTGRLLYWRFPNKCRLPWDFTHWVWPLERKLCIILSGDIVRAHLHSCNNLSVHINVSLILTLDLVDYLFVAIECSIFYLRSGHGELTDDLISWPFPVMFRYFHFETNNNLMYMEINYSKQIDFCLIATYLPQLLHTATSWVKETEIVYPWFKPIFSAV